MNWKKIDNYVELTEFRQFDIGQILECGQAFRFEKIDANHYELIAHGNILNVKQFSDHVRFWYENEMLELEEFERLWVPYFDLNRDYAKIQEIISHKDPSVQLAVEFAPGIRILRQDPWEMIISFIISQNNRIPQIKKVINAICKNYGTHINEDKYTFPTPDQLGQATVDELRALGAGYRDAYIINAVKAVKVHGVKELENRLLEIKGIGEKVADCILLFGYARHERFPIDVWVRRVIEQLYFEGNQMSLGRIKKFAQENFGELAGFAQQYLFHYMRTGYEKESI